MNHLSLFSGMGMTDLATSACGFTTVATAEIEPFCRELLDVRFPDADHYADVRHVDGRDFHGIELITGGFPCQDVSSLGAGHGLFGKRSRLWAEFARIIDDAQPQLVLIENVPLLRSRGLGDVLYDLTRAGYRAYWDCIPAAYVGAPHVRDRIWIQAVRADMASAWNAQAKPLGQITMGMKYPRSGQVQNQIVSECLPRAPLKDWRKKGVWPTPRAAPNEWRTTRNAPSHGVSHGKTLAGEANDRERAAGRTPAPSSDGAGNMNPVWVEWLMGLPFHWTDPTITNEFILPRKRFSTWAHDPAPTIPRTLANVPNRKARLVGLGNGLVPQCAEVSLKEMLGRIELSDLGGS